MIILPGRWTVYLIHLKRPHPWGGGQHYTGRTYNIQRRIRQHRTDKGAMYLRMANDYGIPWYPVRFWIGVEDEIERRVKGCAKYLCPLCLRKHPEYAEMTDRYDPDLAAWPVFPWYLEEPLFLSMENPPLLGAASQRR